MNPNGNHQILDIETLSDCTVFCFDHHQLDDKRVFCITSLKDDFENLIKFLKLNAENGDFHITFNGLAFDSQIVQWMLDSYDNDLFTGQSARTIAGMVYGKAQELIATSNRGEWHEYPEWKMRIRQLDIFKMNHWDSPAKMGSLKWLQCNIDWPNVMDMPIEHTASIKTMDELRTVVTYCFNDVAATKKLYQLSSEQVKIRVELSEKYRLNLYSASEPRMSKEMFLYFLSEKLGMDKRELKKFATHRDKIVVKNILLPYIKFERQEFVLLQRNFEQLVLNGEDLKGAFKYTVRYRGLKIDLGVGGLHAFSKPAVYESTDKMVIKSVDVASYYPNLSIKNGFHPAHLRKKDFCEQYEWFYEERKKYPKGSPINYVLKILLNSTFGLSIDKNSFLSDSSMGMQITINGQLLLCILIEMMCEAIPEAIPLVANTDGFEVMIPRDSENTYHQVCEKWQKITQLTLEHDEYSKMMLFDCNNYIGVFANGKTKCKGRFEFEPHDKYEVAALHKNKSFLVVAKGIFEYFVNGIKPEDYLEQNNNIYDYCGYFKAKGKWRIIKYLTSKTGIQEEALQKTLRYYVSTKGNKIVKRNSEDGREIQIVAGKWMLSVFNVFQQKPFDKYYIDKKFYLDEIYKEIQILEKKNNQFKLDLFA